MVKAQYGIFEYLFWQSFWYDTAVSVLSHLMRV